MPEKDTERLSEEVRQNLDLLRKDLPRRIDILAISRRSKIPWKSLEYRESLIWRFADLGPGAYDEFCKERMVSAITLTRAAAETLAAMWCLRNQIQIALDSRAVGDLHEHVMKGWMGSSNPDADFPSAHRVYKHLIKRTDEDSFRESYETLSEFSHPNYAGAAGLFSRSNWREMTTEFGPDTERLRAARSICINCLSATVMMFMQMYNQVGESIPDLAKLCEELLDGKS